MQRKFILCLFINGNLCLLIFFLYFLTFFLVELLKTQQSIAKTLFTEFFLNYYAGCIKLQNLGGMYFINVHPFSTYPQNFAVLYTLSSLVCMDTLLSTLSSIPEYQKKLRKLFCFVCYLWKSLSLTFLVSESHVRAEKPGWQCLKHNVCGWTYFEHLFGQFFYHGSS